MRKGLYSSANVRQGRRSRYVGKLDTNGHQEWKFGEVPPLEGTPACEEEDPARFDSIDVNTHVKVAVDFCFSCEARRSCYFRRQFMASKLPKRFGPEGTWGGVLFNTKGSRQKVAQRKYDDYANGRVIR